MPSTQSAISVRSLEPLDLPAALAIQSQAYPESLRENRAAFASRLEFPTSYCFAATRHGSVVAYLLAHGWRAESPPPVGVALSSDTTVEVLSVHDLAVSSLERGLGTGQTLIRRAFESAAEDGLQRAELIAVDGAVNFWRRLGFVEPLVSLGLAAKVAAYGPAARWMTRSIKP